MDWFERLTGFQETTGSAGYEQTRRQLKLDGQQLRSEVNGRSYGIGRLELLDLAALRQRAQAGPTVAGPLRARVVQADVRQLHAQPPYHGALFQVASQFNLLEMVGPDITPEQGVTRYQGDHTQGPACAIAAGAATLYRNYFVPVAGQSGQNREHQLDAFAPLGAALAALVQAPAASLWAMRNGYTMFQPGAVDRLSTALQALDAAALDGLRARLAIGLHWDVEVTDVPATAPAAPAARVSQAFCSALPVSYNSQAAAAWAPLATLVLQAAYEATLWAAVINAQRGASHTVLLTTLGGGAFGNHPDWIRAALQHAVACVRGHGLDLVMVSYGPPAPDLRRWVQALAAG